MIRSLKPADLVHQTPQRICVIKPSALGDVVQTLPLLPILKACYPSATISWVINRELKDLVAGNPYVESVIPFDRRGNWRLWLSLLTELRSKKFDMVFDLQGLFRSAVMTMATGARIRVGLQTAREGASMAINCVIPDTSRTVPAHARVWRVAEVLGFADHSKETAIATSESDRIWAEGVLKNLARPVFAVHSGAGWETKRWPIEKFASLLFRAWQNWGGSIVILGSSAERPEAERLHQAFVHMLDGALVPVSNLAGQTSIKQLTRLLRNVDAVISNDSGPMHLAAGLGTPTLGLFTCTSAILSGPAGSQHELVSTKVPCAASYCKRCPKQGDAYLACLQELDVDRAWQSLRRLIEKNRIVFNDPAALRDRS